jgi:two-component system, OmpR family, sensor histidine kinase VicK
LTTTSSSSSSAYHDDNNSGNNYGNSVKNTKVLQGPEKVIDIALQFTSNAENKIDACVDHTRPSLIVGIRELKKAFRDVKKRGVKLRYITEITAENISFCKE